MREQCEEPDPPTLSAFYVTVPALQVPDTFPEDCRCEQTAEGMHVVYARDEAAARTRVDAEYDLPPGSSDVGSFFVDPARLAEIEPSTARRPRWPRLNVGLDRVPLEVVRELGCYVGVPDYCACCGLASCELPQHEVCQLCELCRSCAAEEDPADRWCDCLTPAEGRAGAEVDAS